MLRHCIGQTIQRITAAAAFVFIAIMRPEIAAADLSARVRFDIAAQQLPAALLRYSEQSGVQISGLGEILEGKNSAGVVGTFEARGALEQLLKGTQLRFDVIDANTVAIFAAGQKLEPVSDVESRAVDRELRVAQAETPDGKPQVATKDENESAESKETKDTLVVKGKKPFMDANMDIVRTMNDVQPYHIITGDKIVQSGAPNVEMFLKQQLSMNTTNFTRGQVADQAYGGISTVSLRGLPTLILVNGRRTVGVDVLGSEDSFGFDLNAISPAIIERIEVLPSSASAIYGGSAIGGVINVVLKRDFTGGEMRVAYDTPFDADAPQRTVQGAYGLALEGGRTHLTMSAVYADASAVTVRDRPEFKQRGIDIINRNNPARIDLIVLGSTANIRSSNGSNLVLKDGTPLNSPRTYVPAGYGPGSNPLALLANAGLRNTELGESAGYFTSAGLSGPMGVDNLESVSVTSAFRRQMTEKLEFVAEVFYGRNTSASLVDASAQNHTIPASSPANPFQQAIIVPVLGNDPTMIRSWNESRRVVAGLVFDLPREWRGQGDYTWNEGRAEAVSPVGAAAFNHAGFAAALANGTINPVADQALYPIDMSPYSLPQRSVGRAQVDDVGVRASGPIGALPAGSPNLTLGLAYRKEAYKGGSRSRTSELFPAAEDIQVHLPQSQNVISVYGETLIPLIAARNNVPGIHGLDLQFAVRREDYSVDSGTAFYYTASPALVAQNPPIIKSNVEYTSTNFTTGLSYRPIEDLTFRASYATGFVPPKYSDLLLPRIVGTITGSDPKRGNETFAAQSLRGGNPDLDPMESKSMNLGVIFAPKFIEGLRLGVEWYRIDRKNLAYIPANIFAYEDQYPGRVVRSAAAPGDPYGVGPITLVDTSLLSANKVTMEGFDGTVSYRHRTSKWGSFSLDFQGSLIEKFTRQVSFDGLQEDVAGQVNNGGVLRFRGNAGLGWDYGQWNARWTSYYYSSYPQFQLPTFQAIVLAQGSDKIPSQTYHDLVVGFDAPQTTGFLSDVMFTLGIKNIFNKIPPFDAQPAQRYYYSTFGDPRLRSYWVAASKRF